MAWPMVVRTVCFDELISMLVSGGVDTVINLAAGLDSRPYRMDLPASLQWIEIDFPEMIAYKQEYLKDEVPRCRLERISLDLTNIEGRRQALARINAAASTAVVLTEGLLAYLRPEDVSSLAQDLHDQSHCRYWITDMVAPAILKRTLKYWGKQLASANAPMHFAPEDGTEFFRPQGWKLVEYREMLAESRRLKREMSMAWMLHLMQRLFPGRFAKMQQKWRSGIVLMERV